MALVKNRVVSGMRPTGPLHIGHWMGVLQNWIDLQDKQDCFFFVADWHALTTDYQQTTEIKKYSRELLLDWLAFGIDPEKCVLFFQSQVPAHAELYLLLSMITPISWLERVPSFKEQKLALKDKDLSNLGFLAYPLLQTADVALYDGNLVPVGQDQVAHLEFSREVIRRFNHVYGSDVLSECKALLTKSPKVPGLDGRKMSKSYQNSVYLSDSADDIISKMRQALTDPARIRKSDPGNPDICTVYDYHQLFSSPDEQAQIAQDCRQAQIGCVDCKKKAAASLVNALADSYERRQTLAATPNLIEDIIADGQKKASVIAGQTMLRVKSVMNL